MNQRVPSTESFRDFAGVKRRRVRAGILICAPVIGLRPIRALFLCLRKLPRPARRSEPSFLSSRTTRLVSSSSADFACFFVMPSLSARWAATCDCVIILLLAAQFWPVSKRERENAVIQASFAHFRLQPCGFLHKRSLEQARGVENAPAAAVNQRLTAGLRLRGARNQ